jgi:hypothetical protein
VQQEGRNQEILPLLVGSRPLSGVPTDHFALDRTSRHLPGGSALCPKTIGTIEVKSDKMFDFLAGRVISFSIFGRDVCRLSPFSSSLDDKTTHDTRRNPMDLSMLHTHLLLLLDFRQFVLVLSFLFNGRHTIKGKIPFFSKKKTKFIKKRRSNSQRHFFDFSVIVSLIFSLELGF